MLTDKSRRILLISANREPFPEPVFPIGSVYVGNAFQTTGAKVRIFDIRHHTGISSLQREIATFQPDRIGISLRNIDNAAYPAVRFYLPSYAAMVKSIGAICKAPIILGGSAFSLFPYEIAVHLEADGGIKGEGENAAEIFQEINQGQIVAMEPMNMTNVAFPKNIGELFPGFRRYNTMGIQTARGCPNKCIYCTYPSLEGTRRRVRTAESVVADIAMLYKDFGINSYFFVDSLFNGDEAHMVRVAEKLADQRLPVRFSCYMQPKMSDPGIFRLLKKAGCVAIDFGTDSGSPAMLSALRKSFTQSDISATSLACRKAGIDFCHSLIFGGPGETPETVAETVNLMDEISPRAVIAMTGIRIYPGTEMERIAIQEGVIRAGQSLLQPQFYFSRLEAEPLLRIVRGIVRGTSARRRNWFFPGRRDWSSMIGFRILAFLYRKGPLWRILRK
jgi:radical SAM superfamily enzyme YgiQ (UPF0313 family)